MEDKTRKYLIILLIVLLTIGGIFYIDKSVKEINYRNDFDDIVYSIAECSDDMIDTLNMISKIWYNALFKKADEETDVYTKNEKGYFYSDFNDAVANYYDSEQYLTSIEKIKNQVNKIYSLTKRLQDPPKKYSQAYADFATYYEYFTKLKSITYSQSGMTYEEFTDEYIPLSENVINQFYKMQMYTSY